METSNQQPSVPGTIFAKWNRALLWLLALELGYLILIVLVGLGILAGLLIWNVSGKSLGWLMRAAGVALYPVVFAYLLNFIGACGTVILTLRGKHDGRAVSEWPGHVLNWTYVVATGWIFIAWLFSSLTGGID
jgi:hypothetical protein